VRLSNVNVWEETEHFKGKETSQCISASWFILDPCPLSLRLTSEHRHGILLADLDSDSNVCVKVLA
jgi:hypothetical protein